MPENNALRKRFALSLLVCLLTALVPVTAAEAWDLTDLMRERSEVTEERAEFEETRSVRELREPLQLEGTLVYRAPDYVRKTVTSPERDELEIVDDRIGITNARGYREFEVGEYSELTGIVAAIRGTLAGDLDILERYFRVAFEGERAGWELTLIPRSEALAEAVEEIVIRGDGPDVQRIATREPNGDSSVMRIR